MRLIRILDTAELYRFVGGRKKYNAVRRKLKEQRQGEVRKLMNKMSQRKIAELLDVHPSTICRDIQQIEGLSDLSPVFRKLIKKQQQKL